MHLLRYETIVHLAYLGKSDEADHEPRSHDKYKLVQGVFVFDLVGVVFHKRGHTDSDCPLQNGYDLHDCYEALLLF